MVRRRGRRDSRVPAAEVITVIQEVRLIGGLDRGYPPPAPIARLMRHLPEAVSMALAMSFRGRSNPRGRRPDWLRAMSDIRLVDVAAGSATVARFEVPRFGDAAGDLYRQLELWPTRPAGDDTGFDLLGDILGDLADRRADSEHFDAPLL